MDKYRIASVTAVAAGVAVLAVTAGTIDWSSGGGSSTRQPRPYLTHQVHDKDLKDRRDRFGIDHIYPSRSRAMIWESNWGVDHDWASQADPQDPWFDTDHGTASYKTREGQLWISGQTSRMYIHDPALKRQWRNVEMTVYAERVKDDDVYYSGIVAVARANHLVAEAGDSIAPCDTRGYGGRIRFDGSTDFEKETKHPENDATPEVRLWEGDEMPRMTWIGFKFVVYDESDGVHLETYMDLSGGRNGGYWKKINSYVDDGHSLGVVPCAPDVDPMMKLTASPHRKGSESGKPNVSVYFRADDIEQDGLRYKWASVREIKAP